MFSSSGDTDTEDSERFPLLHDPTFDSSGSTTNKTYSLWGLVLGSIFAIVLFAIFLFAFLLYTPVIPWTEDSLDKYLHPAEKMPNATTHRFYRPFNYRILEEKICESPLDFLIVVLTSVDHFDRRNTFRDTFSNPKWEKRLNFRTVYAVARAKDNDTEERVREESEKYHDIIQADFADSYKNLTIKSMMWLRYVRDYCQKAKYILKMDDDVVFNLFELVEQLHGKSLAIPRSMACSRHYYMHIIRHPKSRWYVSRKALAGKFYEPYCSGPAYLLTTDLVKDLIRQAETHHHYFSIEDVFITGVLASEIGTTANDIWQDKLNIVPSLTENLMLTKQIWFGLYKDVHSFKRIWNNLTITHGHG